jgi:hypothetical protein
VKHLKSLGCNDIEFSPEDAGRSDPEFLYRILGEVGGGVGGLAAQRRVERRREGSGIQQRVRLAAAGCGWPSGGFSEAAASPRCAAAASERAPTPAAAPPHPSQVIAAGATTLNIPDTTGWNLPHEFGGLIAAIKANTPGIESGRPDGGGRAAGAGVAAGAAQVPGAAREEALLLADTVLGCSFAPRITALFRPLADAIISTHCQNDLGLATANSLSGAQNGARQVRHGRSRRQRVPQPQPAPFACSPGLAPPPWLQPSTTPPPPPPHPTRSSAPSTASANARATRRWRRWSWPLRCAGEGGGAVGCGAAGPSGGGGRPLWPVLRLPPR